ncbi:MAG TPA: VOC family protein [Acidimicrobiia bacterium]|nr:VOC family protein [Acidimicrobiia bacterium]
MDLEHVNLSVKNPRRTADLFERLFDWHTRWSGESMFEGECIHVGTDDTYLSLHTRPADQSDFNGYDRPVAHIGVLVEDLDKVVRRVHDCEIETFNHDEVEPGRRFYFFDYDHICYEVASYT